MTIEAQLATLYERMDNHIKDSDDFRFRMDHILEDNTKAITELARLQAVQNGNVARIIERHNTLESEVTALKKTQEEASLVERDKRTIMAFLGQEWKFLSVLGGGIAAILGQVFHIW